MELPKYSNAQQYYISPRGLQKMINLPKDSKWPGKGVLWTDDIKAELPIRMGA